MYVEAKKKLNKKKQKICRNKELNKKINLIYFLNKLKSCSDICKKASPHYFLLIPNLFLPHSLIPIMVQKKNKI